MTDPDKTAAIERLVPPETPTQLRAFLGLAGYYRQFIRDFAGIARLLYVLLAEDTVWAWEPPQQAAFEALKQRLTASPVLVLP